MGHNRNTRTQIRDRNLLLLWFVFSWICVVAATNASAGRLDATSAEVAPYGVAPCLEIESKAERLRCYEQAASARPPDNGAWRLARSPNPEGGPDAISIMHTAETSRSDLDIAGLMLRCADGGIEALVIVIEPRPPRSRPHVWLSALGGSSTFEATVAPPFSALLLPREAAALLTGPWRVATELSIQIDGDGPPVRAIVLLAGLQSALDRLSANCALR